MRDRDYAAFLFDMDGTILDSIASANRVWAHWARRHGLDADEILRVMHGVKAVETIARFAPPGVDVEREFAWLTEAEIADVADVVAIAGAPAFLAALPPHGWAIVTSAPRALAERRLAAAGLPIPAVFVTAEDVVHGKPAPDCFLAAADALGVAIGECLVWEDSPAGIAAAEAAGAAVMVVGATHAAPVATAHRVIDSYAGLAVSVVDDRLRLNL